MCKCEQKTDFKIALREAMAATTDTQKFAVWENKESKEIFAGEVEQAEKRLSKGLIECYFVPTKRKGDQVNFRIVDKPAATEKTASSDKKNTTEK